MVVHCQWKPVNICESHVKKKNNGMSVKKNLKKKRICSYQIILIRTLL